MRLALSTPIQEAEHSATSAAAGSNVAETSAKRSHWELPYVGLPVALLRIWHLEIAAEVCFCLEVGQTLHRRPDSWHWPSREGRVVKPRSWSQGSNKTLTKRSSRVSRAHEAFNSMSSPLSHKVQVSCNADSAIVQCDLVKQWLIVRFQLQSLSV